MDSRLRDNNSSRGHNKVTTQDRFSMMFGATG